MRKQYETIPLFYNANFTNPCSCHCQDRKLSQVVADLFDSDSDDDTDFDYLNEEVDGQRAIRKREGKEKDKMRDLDWPEVAKQVGNHRKSAECMRRYNKISGNKGGEKAAALKGPWTAEEDEKIVKLVKFHGAKRWSQIAAELPGKIRVLAFFCFAISQIQNKANSENLARTHWKAMPGTLAQSSKP